ncbi:MAG: hypothetical protein WCT08_05675 [Patescibacteria group bacterium]
MKPTVPDDKVVCRCFITRIIYGMENVCGGDIIEHHQLEYDPCTGPPKTSTGPADDQFVLKTTYYCNRCRVVYNGVPDHLRFVQS